MRRKGSFAAAAVILAGGLCLSACGEVGESGGETEIIQADKETETVQAGGETGQVGGTEGQAEESAKMDGDKDVPEQSGVSGEGVLAGREKYHLDSFGENVWFFSPEDDPEAVQQELMKLWGVQETNQFGDSRYAVYFLPGEYDEVIRPKVGFYMQVAGLGTMPDDVSLYTVGTDARWLGDNKNHNATCNFWRGVENLSARDYVTWAVSQATFMRRVHLEKTM